MSTAAVRRWWSTLQPMACIVRINGDDDWRMRCGSPAEIAHCHGGSVVERMQEPKAKGKKLPRYDWLVLPICPHHHRLYEDSLDADPEAWEAKYGAQAMYLDWLVKLYGVDVWARAREAPVRRPRKVSKIVPRFAHV